MSRDWTNLLWSEMTWWERTQASSNSPEEMARIAAERLQGSSLGIANLGPEFEALENDSTFCAVLDQLVFCCDRCNWWFEQGEMAEGDEWICQPCGDE